LRELVCYSHRMVSSEILKEIGFYSESVPKFTKLQVTDKGISFRRRWMMRPVSDISTFSKNL
jgi:hypothetical protein